MDLLYQVWKKGICFAYYKVFVVSKWKKEKDYGNF